MSSSPPLSLPPHNRELVHIRRLLHRCQARWWAEGVPASTTAAPGDGRADPPDPEPLRQSVALLRRLFRTVEAQDSPAVREYGARITALELLLPATTTKPSPRGSSVAEAVGHSLHRVGLDMVDAATTPTTTRGATGGAGLSPHLALERRESAEQLLTYTRTVERERKGELLQASSPSSATAIPFSTATEDPRARAAHPPGYHAHAHHSLIPDPELEEEEEEEARRLAEADAKGHATGRATGGGPLVAPLASGTDRRAAELASPGAGGEHPALRHRSDHHARSASGLPRPGHAGRASRPASPAGGRDARILDADDHDQGQGQAEEDEQAVAAVLARNRHVQEELQHELLEAASLLKATSRQLGASIQRDVQVLASTEAALESSVLRTQRERTALSHLTRSSWSTTLLLWVSVVVVACLFAGVLVMLRLWRAPPVVNSGSAAAPGTAAGRSLMLDDAGWSMW